MADWAPVSIRKLHGEYGLYRDELMQALIADDQLFTSRPMPAIDHNSEEWLSTLPFAPAKLEPNRRLTGRHRVPAWILLLK